MIDAAAQTRLPENRGRVRCGMTQARGLSWGSSVGFPHLGRAVMKTPRGCCSLGDILSSHEYGARKLIDFGKKKWRGLLDELRSFMCQLETADKAGSSKFGQNPRKFLQGSPTNKPGGSMSMSMEEDKVVQCHSGLLLLARALAGTEARKPARSRQRWKLGSPIADADAGAGAGPLCKPCACCF